VKTSTLIRLGANYVVEVEREDSIDDRPRLTFYRLEVTECLTEKEAKALAAALVHISTGADTQSSRDVANRANDAGSDGSGGRR
jgi:hypothetical protein